MKRVRYALRAVRMVMPSARAATLTLALAALVSKRASLPASQRLWLQRTAILRCSGDAAGAGPLLMSVQVRRRCAHTMQGLSFNVHRT